MMRCLIFISVVFITLLCSLFTNGQSLNDDIDMMRQSIIETALWPSKNNISSIVQLATSFGEKMNSTCYWEDINYDDTTRAVWANEEHLIRVDYMLQALTVPGSPLQNDSRLATKIHCALNVWLVRDWINPNWWFNQIGIPLLITGELLLLGDSATPFEIEKITNISYRADWWAHDPGTGANLVWMLQVELYRSVATKNRTGIQESLARMWRDLAVLPVGGQGIQNDWAYHFHGNILYPAGYGQDWAVAVAIALASTNGTQYAPTQERIAVFGNFLTQGDAWMLNGDIWDWQVQGRGFDRPGTVFGSLGFELQPDLIRSIADLVQTQQQLKTNLLNFADRLDNKPNAVQLIGNKHFYTSDYQAHRRRNWTAAIKMQSVRTQPTECVNGENLKGEHLGQGVLTVYTNNATEYRSIFPLLDWQAINGITVEHDILLEPCHGSFEIIKLSFVGGASDGQYGLAVMDTATHNLTAKRSWHFYDDAIIALANNITLTTQNTAWTTLASRLLANGNITVGFFNGTIVSLSDGINYSFPYTNTDQTNNVQWIHLSETNIGYLLQTQGPYSSLRAEISQKTASYKTIGPYNETITGRTVVIAIDHGQGPYTRDYSYMILPNVSVETMPDTVKRYEGEGLFSCISTNSLFQGVAWPSLQRASFVLWNNVTTTFSCQSSSFKLNAEVSHDGIYLFNETATEFSITASHPILHNTTVSVTVDRVGMGQGCAALSDSTTVVTIPLPSSNQYLGSSVTVTCKKRQLKTC